MKVRKNAKRKLVSIQKNNKYTWIVAPIIARSKIIKERNDRIKALVDKAFP
jgi:hypothetical protein